MRCRRSKKLFGFQTVTVIVVADVARFGSRHAGMELDAFGGPGNGAHASTFAQDG